MPWKMGQISPLDHRAGCPGAASRPHLASALQQPRKSANIHASSGIRRIPVILYSVGFAERSGGLAVLHALPCETAMNTARHPAAKVSPSLVTAFIAGALAVPIFHQLLFLLFYLLGVIPVAPFSLKPTVPFGVPEVISSSFWGGVWGIVFVLTLPRFFHGRGYWLASAIIGGLALTLVYMFVVVPLKTSALPPNMGGLFIIGFLLNAAWGIGWALLLMVFDRLRGQPITAW